MRNKTALNAGITQMLYYNINTKAYLFLFELNRLPLINNSFRGGAPPRPKLLICQKKSRKARHGNYKK